LYFNDGASKGHSDAETDSSDGHTHGNAEPDEDAPFLSVSRALSIEVDDSEDDEWNAILEGYEADLWARRLSGQGACGMLLITFVMLHIS
jgi:hypothetical protein